MTRAKAIASITIKKKALWKILLFALGTSLASFFSYNSEEKTQFLQAITRKTSLTTKNNSQEEKEHPCQSSFFLRKKRLQHLSKIGAFIIGGVLLAYFLRKKTKKQLHEEPYLEVEICEQEKLLRSKRAYFQGLAQNFSNSLSALKLQPTLLDTQAEALLKATQKMIDSMSFLKTSSLERLKHAKNVKKEEIDLIGSILFLSTAKKYKHKEQLSQALASLAFTAFNFQARKTVQLLHTSHESDLVHSALALQENSVKLTAFFSQADGTISSFLLAQKVEKIDQTQIKTILESKKEYQHRDLLLEKLNLLSFEIQKHTSFFIRE